MGRVLVIDDEISICDQIGEYFRDSVGLSVQCANSGTDGAQVLAREHFDLVLIDVTVRGSSGLELATLAANEDTPVLLISGHPEFNLMLRLCCMDPLADATIILAISICYISVEAVIHSELA